MKPAPVWTLAICLTLVSQFAVAQDTGQHSGQKQPSPPADAKMERWSATEKPADDIEFNLMGEYLGPLEASDGASETVGLQVRPIGNQTFEAIQFEGGLPGLESYTGNSTKLIGRRSGDFIILSGGEYAIFVEEDSCSLIDRRGKMAGRLDRVVRDSPTMGAPAPEEATVLFDGSGIDQFSKARMTPNGLLMEGADVLPMFQDFDLHVEFRLPYMPTSDGQQRGNSGCYLQSRYEVQVLDSFAQPPVFNGCSSLYRTKAPDLNMCLPPLQWQTYDIRFTAPRWGAGGEKLRNARITVWQNGVKTQDDVELQNKTGAGKEEAPTLLPIRFQDHSDPVRYRNIWIVDRGLAHVDFPVYPSQDDAAHGSEDDAGHAAAEEAVELEAVELEEVVYDAAVESSDDGSEDNDSEEDNSSEGEGAESSAEVEQQVIKATE